MKLFYLLALLVDFISNALFLKKLIRILSFKLEIFQFGLLFEYSINKA